MGFKIENGVLKKYTGENGVTEAVIPDSVTSIGDYAFRGCSSLTSITIPDSVTSIGYGSFQNCSSLTSITIPDSVISIDWYAFAKCISLTSITIPDSVTSIGEMAFYECSNLTSITVPGSVRCDYSSFPKDHLFLLNNIPIYLTYGEDVNYQNKLIKKTIAGDTITAEFLQEAKCRETKEPIYLHLCRNGQKDGSAYVKRFIIRYASNAIDSNSLSMLKEFEGFGFFTKTNMTKIAEYALDKEKQNNEIIIYLLDVKKRLGKFKLEEIDRMLEKAQGNVEVTAWLLECKNKQFTVEDIDKIETKKMEKELGLRKLTLSEWKKIFTLDSDISGGYRITGYMGEETDIIIPDVIGKKKVTVIDEYAFSPEKERLPQEIKKIRTKVTSIVIPDMVTNIGEYAFYECSSLASITIPDSVTSIGEKAFAYCSSLTSITIPDSVTSIGYSAFLDTKWLCDYPDDFVIVNGILIGYKGKEKAVIIPDTVTSVGNGAFYECSRLTSITIPDSVTSIGEWSFAYCSRLTNITIPDSVINIEIRAFDGCKNLTINAPENSYAIKFAKKKKIHYQMI